VAAGEKRQNHLTQNHATTDRRGTLSTQWERVAPATKKAILEEVKNSEYLGTNEIWRAMLARESAGEEVSRSKTVVLHRIDDLVAEGLLAEVSSVVYGPYARQKAFVAVPTPKEGETWTAG
jgi:hypothetical protein